MDIALEQLVKQAHRELPYDVRAFEQLAAHYYPIVRSVGRRVVGNRDEAETVAQDALLRVFHHLPRLRDPARFEGWIRRITVNVAKSYISKERREREITDAAGVELALVMEAPLIQQKDSDLFAQLLTRLNLEERSILALRFVDDLGFADIAAHLGLKLSATKMRYYRALEKLQCAITVDEQLDAITVS